MIVSVLVTLSLIEIHVYNIGDEKRTHGSRYLKGQGDLSVWRLRSGGSGAGAGCEAGLGPPYPGLRAKQTGVIVKGGEAADHHLTQV